MKRWWIYAPVALCFLLMPWLAYQQYVWLGQLSVDEEDRLRRGLERTAEQLQARLQFQFLGLQGRGRMGGPPWMTGRGEGRGEGRGDDRDAQQELESQYASWRAEARFPQIVKRALVRMDEDGHCRERLAGTDKLAARWIDLDPMACQVGLDVPWRLIRPIGRGAALLFYLDAKEVKEHVLPVLAQELGLSSEDYSVTVLESAEMKKGEVSVPMPWGPGMGRGRMNLGGPPSGAPGGLRLVLTRTGEPIGEIVASARRRNLAVSFLVMLVLLSALLLMAWVARRSEELARRQMEFVAGVSHELRTPLAVICSAAENLADGVAVSESRVKTYGKLIANEGRHLAEMVEEILGYARGKRSMEAAELFAVQGIVDKALEGCRVEIEGSGCVVERSFSEDGLWVEGEQRALIHAVRNLVANAAKYGRSGGWIGVSVKRRGKMAEIEVADRGPGFEAGEGKKIFEAFHRGKGALTEQVHGLGLGLTLVQRVAEMHDGKVEAVNDGGARFRILLPLAQEKVEA
jgi:signal transduction histidine kinase